MTVAATPFATPSRGAPPDLGPNTEAVLQIIRRIGSVLRPKAIILFGSRARGEAHAESDVDLLVVWRDENPPALRSAEVRRAIGRQPLPMDVAVVTPSEFERLRSRKAHIVGIASREGIVVDGA